MPPTDGDELRALQQKAYGRDGGLTDAEAVRLRELEDARDAGASVDEPPGDALVREEDSRSGGGIGGDAPPERASSSRTDAAAAPEHAAAAPELTAAGLEHASADPGRNGFAERRVLSSPVVAVSDDAAGSPGGAPRALRQHWRIVAAASAVLLAIGVGAGWALFGRGVLPVPIPEDQQAALAMIEEGAYDPGSIRFVGEKHGLGIWTAMQDEGAEECLVLTHEDRQQFACEEIGDETPGGFIPGVSTGIDFVEDGESVQVWATIVPDISGTPVTIVQRAAAGGADWREQFTSEEIEAAERLEAEGFEPGGLQLVGYDGDIAVWQGHRPGEFCLAAVIGAQVHLGCEDSSQVRELQTLRVGTTEYRLLQTQSRGPMFSITRNAPAEGRIDPLEPGGEHGDPIEVTPDDTEP